SPQSAASWGDEAGEQLHQRAFTRAIGPHHRSHARREFTRDVREGQPRVLWVDISHILKANGGELRESTRTVEWCEGCPRPISPTEALGGQEFEEGSGVAQRFEQHPNLIRKRLRHSEEEGEAGNDDSDVDQGESTTPEQCIGGRQGKGEAQSL